MNMETITGIDMMIVEAMTNIIDLLSQRSTERGRSFN